MNSLPLPRHRFFAPVSRLVEGESIALSKRQARQIFSVLRMRPGAQIRVFNGIEPFDHVLVLSQVSAEVAVGTISEAACQADESVWRLWVYPALLPRDKFEQVLQKLTEVGAAGIVPVIAERSVVRSVPDERQRARWRSILVEAAEQSGRRVVPELAPTLPFAAALKQGNERGPVLLADRGGAAVPLIQAARMLAQGWANQRPAPPGQTALTGAGPRTFEAVVPIPGRCVSLFVGPEGGFSTAERRAAVAGGAVVVTCGPTVLRAETASPVHAAVLLHLLDGQYDRAYD